MHTILIVIHIIASLALISIVLLQHGKGAGIGAAFGGSSQTVFGSTGAAPFLAKLTAIVAVVSYVHLPRPDLFGQAASALGDAGGGKTGGDPTGPGYPGPTGDAGSESAPQQMSTPVPKWWNLVDTPS